MKRNKLESFSERVVTHSGMLGDKKINYFILVDNKQFVDLDNLEKYTISDLKRICWHIGKFPSGKGWKKKDLINLIKSADLSKLIADNREVQLDKLLS